PRAARTRDRVIRASTSCGARRRRSFNSDSARADSPRAIQPSIARRSASGRASRRYHQALNPIRPATSPQAAIVRTTPAHPLLAVDFRAPAIAGAVGSGLAAMADSVVMVTTAHHINRRWSIGPAPLLRPARARHATSDLMLLEPIQGRQAD